MIEPIAARLEHVGSTSVPGLAAKPSLDLQVSVAAIEPRSAYVAPLQALMYEVLKRDVAGRHPEDRPAYVEGKQPYMIELEARAFAWARNRAYAARSRGAARLRAAEAGIVAS